MSIYVPSRVEAKAALGPGAAAWLTQPMAPWVGGGGYSRPQKFMRQCAAFWKTDPWIRAAERVISGKFSTVDWVLEDAKDTEIDDEYPDKRYLQPRDLMEQPQKNLPSDESQHLTRREIWSLTCRHMGVTGNAFWYLDKLESQARTPLDILYIAPWRMWPVPDARGNLVAWMLDWNEQTNSGTRLELDEVIHFTLEPPEEGFFGIGLVETAMTLATLDKVAMNHAIQVLQSGGRLAGIVAPKDAASALPDDKFQQLVRDFRTINELPDAAKRLNILQGPVDFLPTAANMHDLLLKDLLTLDRDFILELWGVPLSQIGGSAGGGLNSGETKKYDEAALWQGAIHPRLVAFTERVQFDLLDRYQKLGITVELEIEEPAFDDDGPRFDLLAKSAGTPMRNFERRALINLEPFGDVALDNAVWMPSLTTEAFIAPDENGVIVASAMPELPQPPAPMVIAPGEQWPRRVPCPRCRWRRPRCLRGCTRRIYGSLTKLRSRIEREHTSTLKTSLADFLQKQKQDIASRLRAERRPHRPQAPRDGRVVRQGALGPRTHLDPRTTPDRDGPERQRAHQEDAATEGRARGSRGPGPGKRAPRGSPGSTRRPAPRCRRTSWQAWSRGSLPLRWRTRWRRASCWTTAPRSSTSCAPRRSPGRS